MDDDLSMMIYGVLLGAVSSLVTSIVTSIFQYWLSRRKYERWQLEEQHNEELKLELPTGAVEAGSIVFSIVVTGLLLLRMDKPNLSLAFTVIPGYLLTKVFILKLIKR